MAFWNRFFGGAGSTAAGVAIGATAVPALQPAAQEIVNQTWSKYPNRPPDVYVLAEGVAQGQVNEDAARNWSHEQGLGDEQFDALVAIADVGPAFGQLMDAYRRGLIDTAGFDTGLNRLAIEPRWWPALRSLRRTLLSPSEAANARQQTWISQAEQYAIAAEHGLTQEDAEIQFLTVGLPPGIETGLVMLRRGIIDVGQFAEIVATSHTKTKWTDELLELRTPILSATEWATLHLKGHATEAEMNAGGALEGYTPAQMNLLYLGMGRPAAPGQMWTAATRGIDGPAGRPMDEAQFQQAIAQSDIRPEYGPMLWAIRYLYPSLFQLTRLVSSGTITPAIGADWARKARYAPEVVTALLASWTGGTTAKADPHVGRAETHLWSTTHASYKAEEIDDATVLERLTLLGVDPAAQQTILGLWQSERALIRKQLTPAQVKKAWAKQVRNPDTGAAWTRDDALAELVQRGYSVADANTFLDE